MKKFFGWGLVAVVGFIWMLVQEDIKGSMPQGWILALAGQLSDWLMVDLTIKRWEFLLYNLAILLTVAGLSILGWKISSSHNALVDEFNRLASENEELTGCVDLKDEETANLEREISELKENELKLNDAIQKLEQQLKSLATPAELTLDQLPVDEQAVMVFMGWQKNDGRGHILDGKFYELTHQGLNRIRIDSAKAQLENKKLIRKFITSDGYCYLLEPAGLKILASAPH